ncbi:hypothetical protein BV898_11556 [Hypsibius exemplaris]|uniref:Uncharacterized protein n=1 Tax=Hypsibius exemplaris TaxID=2072580 RepID=A0A1W0WGE7_HYPEX|nr:hypothetical protein BV898_11556 [Hypsibius exemplaris]
MVGPSGPFNGVEHDQGLQITRNRMIAEGEMEVHEDIQKVLTLLGRQAVFHTVDQYDAGFYVPSDVRSLIGLD